MRMDEWVSCGDLTQVIAKRKMLIETDPEYKYMWPFSGFHLQNILKEMHHLPSTSLFMYCSVLFT